MLSPARFYKMKGALTSGEYPLFQEGQILTDYLVHEVTIKHTKDIQQVVRVPAFEGFRDVNVCEIEGLFYWVTAFHENTIEESSVRFVLDLMAPTSFVRKGDILDGFGRSVDAVECYRKARTIDPKRADAWRGEAVALKKAGRMDEAKAAASSYLGLVPTDAQFKAQFKDAIAK